MQMQLWIKNYENEYAITSDARVLSYIRDANGYELKPHLNSKGYLTVELRGKVHKLHRLVAEHFVEGYKEGLVPNHKDGVKTNCLPSNLEWVTHSENTLHAYRLGLVPLNKGQRKDSRVIVKYDKEGNKIRTYNSLTEAAKDVTANVTSGVSKIKQVCEKYSYNGYVRKTAFGFKWSYDASPNTEVN